MRSARFASQKNTRTILFILAVGTLNSPHQIHILILPTAALIANMVDYEKVNWDKTLRKLSKDVQVAERTLAHFLDDEEFLKDRRELLRSREDCIARTQKRLQSFKAALFPIKERLEDICHGRSGAEVIQPLLESYEKKLTDFKILMRDEFVELENEEHMLTRDMHVAASRLEGWLAVVDGSARPEEAERIAEVKQRQEVSEQRLTDELERLAKIGAIDKQITTSGGRTGGWDSRDHDAFIRVWTQTGCAPTIRPPPQIISHSSQDVASSSSSPRKGGPKSPSRNQQSMMVVGNNGNHETIHEQGEDEKKQQQQQGDIHNKGGEIPVLVITKAQHQALLRKLPIAVPGKTNEDFIDHILWYLMFLSLNTEKKKLVLKWKDEKLEQEKAEEEAMAKSVQQAMRGLQESRQTPEDMMNEAYKEVDDRAEQRVKVMQWKEEREKVIRLKEEKDKEKERIKAKEEADEWQRRQQATRLQIEQWKEADRITKAETLKAKEDAAVQLRRATSADPAEARRRRERDAEALRLRKEKIEARQRELRPRSEKIEKIEANVGFDAKRDKDRLLAPTKAFSAQMVSGEAIDEAERRRATISAHSATVAGSGRDLKGVGRAVPAWTKGGGL